MKIFDLMVGAITILTLIFALSPSTLEEVRSVDPSKLIVFCMLILCIFYWIRFTIRHFLPKKKRVRIIRDSRDPDHFTYLVERKNICFHIPDPETFSYLGSYFGFSWKDLEDFSPEEFKRKFVIGRQLPSIRSYFPKIAVVTENKQIEK